MPRHNCLAIETVHSKVKVPPTTIDGFGIFDYKIASDIKLYVPLTCAEDYEHWDYFHSGNIIEEGTEGMTELQLLRATVNELKHRKNALKDGDINEDGKVNVEDITKVVSKALKKY